MAKGSENPLTEVMRRAETIVEERATRMFAEYGIPLYVTEGGRNALLEWPEDPEAVTPEEMQVLCDTRGEEAVNTWLMEHYSALAEQEPA